MTAVSPTKVHDVVERLRKLGVTEQDLVEKFVRASGHGGQKVNKTSSAVYLHHIPSGIEVKSQSSRSQSENRFMARRRLAEKLEALEGSIQSEEASRIAKIRRQKRKRSKRAKDKMLSDKRVVSEKKKLRKVVKTSE